MGLAKRAPKCKVIAMFNQKGGVGKSTSTIQLAAALARLEKKVLVIDADSQGTVTKNLGFRNAVTGESRFKAEGFAVNNMRYEMFMKSVKRHLEGVKSITIQDAQYIIKDVDEGVDYVRLDERNDSKSE